MPDLSNETVKKGAQGKDFLCVRAENVLFGNTPVL